MPAHGARKYIINRGLPILRKLFFITSEPQMNQSELIVPYKKDIHTSTLSVALVIGCLIFQYSFFTQSDILHRNIKFAIYWFLVSLITLILAALLYFIYLSRGQKIAARLDRDGIWVHHYGFIPWDEITEFEPYYQTPIVGIGIRVKDPEKLSKQSAFGGKSGVFWSKKFGYPHVILSNLEIANEEIIDFKNQL